MTQPTVRWFLALPVMCLGLAYLLGEAALYTVLRLVVYCIERFWVKQSHSDLRKARSYDEYVTLAVELDRVQGKCDWRTEDESPLYDHELLCVHSEKLRSFLFAQDWPRVAEVLAMVAHKNVGNCNSEELFSRTHFGTKTLVSTFTSEVVEAVRQYARAEAVPLAARLALLEKLSATFGRTALCLSGGGANGFYHIGVIKALHEQGLLPSIVSGSSGGALIGAFLCSCPPGHLATFLAPSNARLCTAGNESTLTKVLRFIRKGYVFDAVDLKNKLRGALGDVTFAEAYERTGRVLNISITSAREPWLPKVLNFRSSPDVVLYSAVIASSCFPGLLGTTNLLIKRPDGTIEPYNSEGTKWFDGSVRIDVPYQHLSQSFGVNSIVVSQVNPHIIPFAWDRTGSAGKPLRRRRQHRMRGGFFTSALERYLKLDMVKWMQWLSELGLFPRVLGCDLSTIFLQDVFGTVTIVPPFSLYAYLCIISDPTEERMSWYTLEGERSTWPKVEMIKGSFLVERAIEESLAHLRKAESLESADS